MYNSGIGDMNDLVGREQVGVILQDFEETSYQRSAVQALTSLTIRVLMIGQESCSILRLRQVGGKQYVE